jgi:hypothetical protein
MGVCLANQHLSAHGGTAGAWIGMDQSPVISDAGNYFYDFVKQAAKAEPLPPRRRGGRLRRKATVHSATFTSLKKKTATQGGARRRLFHSRREEVPALWRARGPSIR